MRCDNPIFIGGCGSSGSTLLSHLLNMHPEIYCGPEWYIAHIPQLFEKWPLLSSDDKRQLIVRGTDGVAGIAAETLSWLIHGQRCSVSKFINPKHRHGRAADDVTLIDWACESRSLPEFVDTFFEDLLIRVGKKRWAEKTPVNCYAICEILGAFPEARYIHTVRDGRDVALSLMSRGYDARQAVQRWLYDSSTIFQFVNHARCFVVRYEDLVQYPAKTVRELLSFIGSDPELAPVIVQAASSQTEPDFAVVRSWGQSPTETISVARIGKWRQLEGTAKAQLARYFHHVFLNDEGAKRIGLALPANANAVNRAFGYPADPTWPERNAPSFALLKEFMRERKRDIVTAPYIAHLHGRTYSKDP